MVNHQYQLIVLKQIPKLIIAMARLTSKTMAAFFCKGLFDVQLATAMINRLMAAVIAQIKKMIIMI